MKKLLIVFALLAFTVPALAGTNGQGIGVNNAIGTAGQLIGTTTNDSANTGNIGEESIANIVIGSAVSATTATAVDITSLALGSGDWLCWANAGTSAAAGTTTTSVTLWLNTTSATNPASAGAGAFTFLPYAIAAGINVFVPIGQRRIQVAAGSTTTVYLSAQIVFAVSTLGVYGRLACRRMR